MSISCLQNNGNKNQAQRDAKKDWNNSWGMEEETQVNSLENIWRQKIKKQKFIQNLKVNKYERKTT